MKSDHVVTVTDSSYEGLVQGPLPVLIELGAAWCPPCRAMEPHLEAVATAYAGRLTVGTCDMDVQRGVAAQFRVQSVPTFVVLRDGKVVDRVVGAMSRPRLEALVQRAIS